MMKRFNPNKVRALGNLQTKTDAEKRAIKRLNGTRDRWSMDTPAHPVKAVREYLAPVDPSYRPPRLRGRSGTRLSHEKRAMVLDKAYRRAAFFASIGVQV